MKRAFLSFSAAAIALSVASAVAATPTTPASSKGNAKSTAGPKAKPTPKLSKWQQHVMETMKNSAPGDEYFGRMKMSFLGINNTFHDDAIRAGAYTTDSHLISHSSFADEALNAWAGKYPNDPQLARSYFLAFQLYRKVWILDDQQKAWNYAHIVIKKWPSSYFGKLLQKDLSIGFTMHYFADPVPCESLVSATPLPSPGRNATPAPSPSPTLTPTPTPTPSPAPGQPKVDILPAPCLTPSPSPTPVPLPTGSISPLPSGAPSAIPSASPTALPSGAPTTTPSGAPTIAPSGAPSATPAPNPAATPLPNPPVTPTPSATRRPH